MSQGFSLVFVNDINVIKMLYEGGLINLQLFAQFGDYLAVDDTLVDESSDKMWGHSQVRSECIRALLDARRSPRAADVRDASGT